MRLKTDKAVMLSAPIRSHAHGEESVSGDARGSRFPISSLSAVGAVGRTARLKIQGPYNTIRPHASLGYKSPAPQVFIPTFARVAGCAMSTGFGGHDATASLKRTFEVDHYSGANQGDQRHQTARTPSRSCRDQYPG